ncbi:MAG: sulfide/dihydroorotate dehydrogenase-like FAD/NAD-binding protein [Bryobacteraceae bacterium]|jgi:ferredoxin--NADP+ reductase
MFRILRTRALGRNIKLFEVEAPRIASKQKPGQFVILRLHDRGERIPLTIEGSDPKKGSITLVVQSIGKTTSLMNSLEAGDVILDVVGPLGKPSEIHNYGTAVVIGGSVGTAVALPTARALKEAGNRVIGITGSRSKDLLVLEDELRAVSHETFVMTDDGSYGEQGLVTKKLQELIDSGLKIDLVLAIGPVPMMRAVWNVARPHGIKTVVSLNSIMVDGTGMCGGCRVLAGDKSKFACVDGPEFDAAEINFDVLVQRNNMYRGDEKRSLDKFLANPEEDLKLMRDLRSRADRERCQLETLEAAAKREVSDAVA